MKTYCVVYRVSYGLVDFKNKPKASLRSRKQNFGWHKSFPMSFGDACVFAENVYGTNQSDDVETDNYFHGEVHIVESDWLKNLPQTYESQDFFKNAPENPGRLRRDNEKVIAELRDKNENLIRTFEINPDKLQSNTKGYSEYPRVVCQADKHFWLKYTGPKVVVYEMTEAYKVEETPKEVGCWVACCTPELDFIKWGIDGDTIYPYPTYEEALDQAKYLKEHPCHKTDKFYILVMFENGQMRTDEIS